MAETHEHLWFTRRAGQIRGPFPQRQITRYILLGRIRKDDELSTDRSAWTVVAELPHLIPDVMRSLETEEDQQRLQAARMREDERRGGDRRLGSERMQADNGERRRESDRRQDEDSEMLRHRELRRAVLDEARTTRNVPCGPFCVRAAIALVVVIGLFVIFTPDKSESETDCAAPAGPRVNWENCRLPGISVEQADLRGAQARNMDLTGAHLVGADLTGADLSYSALGLVDLRHANLSYVRLTGTGLQNADLRGTRLTSADFSYADLRGARFESADLASARFDHAIWIDGHRCQPGSIGKCLVIDKSKN